MNTKISKNVGLKILDYGKAMEDETLYSFLRQVDGHSDDLHRNRKNLIQGFRQGFRAAESIVGMLVARGTDEPATAGSIRRTCEELERLLFRVPGWFFENVDTDERILCDPTYNGFAAVIKIVVAARMGKKHETVDGREISWIEYPKYKREIDSELAFAIGV